MSKIIRKIALIGILLFLYSSIGAETIFPTEISEQKAVYKCSGGIYTNRPKETEGCSVMDNVAILCGKDGNKYITQAKEGQKLRSDLYCKPTPKSQIKAIQPEEQIEFYKKTVKSRPKKNRKKGKKPQGLGGKLNGLENIDLEEVQGLVESVMEGLK